MKGRIRGALTTVLAITAAGAGGVRGQEAVEVPLRVEAGRLIAAVDVGGGIRADFIVSTGNGVTVLAESFAAAHGKDGPFRMGEVPVQMENAATVPDDQLEPGGVVGIVGANSLNRYDVLVDLPNERLLLKPSGRAVEWAGVALGEPIPLRVYHGIVIGLDVALDGTGYPAMLDIGADALVVNRAVGAGLGIAPGADGRATLTVGGRDFPGSPVRVREHPVIERFDPDGKGFLIVGAGFTEDCAVSISWIHREMRVCAR